MSEENGNNRAQHYFPMCAQLRAGKGLTKKVLSSGSNIDRATLNKIENGKSPVTIEKIMCVFNYLNEKHYNSELSIDNLISKCS